MTATSGDLLVEERTWESSAAKSSLAVFFLHLKMNTGVLLFGEGEMTGENKTEKPLIGNQPRSQ